MALEWLNYIAPTKLWFKLFRFTQFYTRFTHNLAYPTFLSIVFFCNFNSVFAVFIAIMFIVLKVHMLQLFESLMHCLFCFHVFFLLLSSIIWLLSSDILLLHILPCFHCNCLWYTIAYAKLLKFCFNIFDIFIILFNFGHMVL